ncbi:MAG: hypothetical protein Q4P78_01140 [Rothia sp. (in: high G+C Gram-positive bacteria)]|uniref:hypothetical protein n=1 Tax=Rothia sp. (in: high G+C Gram-positive bacteria) TaxID=1885016 RepID=UPI0026E096E7|nr:hypothetical protein [Rothia sp. (in: high G+C Gram-positive bacteria)]MDO5749791.1 hypothetical protein [Rothia sp. (in: high G+C Gram-positive bacteria)]
MSQIPNPQNPQQSASSQQAQRSDHSAWDAAFASDEATVLLDESLLQNAAPSPAAAQRESAPQSAYEAPASGDISWLDTPDEEATTPVTSLLRPAVPAAVTTAIPQVAPAASAPAAAPEATIPGASSAAAVSTPAPSAHVSGAETDLFSPEMEPSDALSAQQQRFGRMQIIPGLMGLAAFMGAFSFFSWAISLVLHVAAPAILPAGASLPSAPDTVSQLLAQGSNGVLYASLLGGSYLLSAWAGGYTAARMARFAPVKQGWSVWLWLVLSVGIASVLTAAMPGQFSGSFAPFSAQSFLTTSVQVNGFLAFVLFLLIALLGALLGGLCGRIYHRRVERYPSVEH